MLESSFTVAINLDKQNTAETQKPISNSNGVKRMMKLVNNAVSFITNDLSECFDISPFNVKPVIDSHKLQ